jgi:Alpha-L-arabinofuranosidase B (ABFB) domain
MEVMEFRSLNFRDHFIRHRNFLGELTKKEGPAEDFLFALVPREQGRVALRSKNFPKLFLRHRDFRLRLEGPNGPNDQLFAKDSTFFLVPGLADPKRHLVRVVQLPGPLPPPSRLPPLR